MKNTSGSGIGRWVVLLTTATVLVACSGKQNLPSGEVAKMAEIRVDPQRVSRVAYEHAIEMEVRPGNVREVSDIVQRACAALPERGCTLLEANIHGGANAGATVRMRVSPDGVNKVLGVLDGRGKVLTQSTRGEDLAEPIEDAERKMAMLASYRDQLQTLARQRALDPEALIKLHRELATVMSEIDKAATSRSQLRRRVDTELLTVDLHEPAKAGQAGRVKQAVEDFGQDFLQGVAMLITFVASVIPFAVAGFLAYLAWRRVRAGRRRAASLTDKP